MNNTLDIVALVNNNPLTKLTGNDYQSRIISKIKEKFTSEEQQLFVSSFYMYLNYDSRTDFIIELGKIWKWLGYSRIDHCKTMLLKFRENIDFKVQKPASENAGAGKNLSDKGKNLGGSGINKEQILLTINCFKKLCLKSRTDKADEIHDYYIQLEEIIHDTVMEESSVLLKQLQFKDKERDQLLEKTLIEKHPYHTQCIYYGTVDNVSDDGETLIKFGETYGLERRIKEHKRDYKNFKIKNAFKVSNAKKIENTIKLDTFLMSKIRSINVRDEENRVELLAYNNTDCTIDIIEKRIKKIIKDNELDIQTLKNENRLLRNLLKQNNINLEDVEGLESSDSDDEQMILKPPTVRHKICPKCGKGMYETSGKCSKCHLESRTKEEPEEQKVIKNPSNKTCTDCGIAIFRSSTRCISCAAKQQTRKVTNRPSLEQLEADLEELGTYTAVGRKYEVSDNCIRKWIKGYKKLRPELLYLL